MLSRRQILGALGTAALAGPASPETRPNFLVQRTLGRTGRWVVPFGLGGQASLQFASSGLDAADIIVRAIELGVNYLDTANAYNTSQAFYGQAMWRLHLTPGDPAYDGALRERLYIASKTGQRYALDKSRPTAATALDDLKRTMTTLFGDGKGWVPEGAYLDAFQIHNLTTLAQVDQIYEGLDKRWEPRDRIGALALLLDYRDGTNHTGLNPYRKHWIRHIGITSHQSSPVLINALQRDELNIIDTMLVALNANDRNYSSHQFNAIPVARARGVGIIAMKVFCAGGMYTGMQRQPNNATELILSVGYPGGVDSADLVRYPLSVAGVGVVIAGIGKIDRTRPEMDQLASNLAASQIDSATDEERRRIEQTVAERHGTGTNYFQDRLRAIAQPPAPKVERDGERVTVSWSTALAASEPLRSYRIWSGDRLIAVLPFRPQTTTAPLWASLEAGEVGDGPVRVEASTEPPPVD